MGPITHDTRLNIAIFRVTGLLDILLQDFADRFLRACDAILRVVCVHGVSICDASAVGEEVGECTQKLIVVDRDLVNGHEVTHVHGVQHEEQAVLA